MDVAISGPDAFDVDDEIDFIAWDQAYAIGEIGMDAIGFKLIKKSKRVFRR